MKKLCILVCMTLPLFGLVWSEDPILTEEQKEERREINRRISENMREMSKEKQRWISEQREKGNEQEKDGESREPIMGADRITWGPSAVVPEETEDDMQEDFD